jgi:hypothetical protein
VDVEISAGNTSSVKLPVSLGDQLIFDAAEAVNRRETAAAQKLIDRARALQARGRLSRAAVAELTYQQARIHEETANYLEAMTEYEALGKLPERKPEHTTAALGASSKLQPYLGRLIISKDVDGQCTTVMQWVRPGEHVSTKIDLCGFVPVAKRGSNCVRPGAPNRSRSSPAAP